jgi:sugar O-acyltransferase (sialic acid O-acetyltransferase NeuD family)
MTGRPIVLVGAGGLGRETAALLGAITDAGAAWRPIGFVDDDPTLQGATVAGLPVLGPIASAPAMDAAVVLCTARPAVGCSRARLAARLDLPAERYPALVHPGAHLTPSCTVGPGTVVFAGVVATAEVTLGAHVVVMPQVVLTHDDVIEDHATFAAGVRLGGGVRIGREAYLGAGAMVREGLTVGPSALVGMGSVVLRDVPAGEVWGGNPAHPLALADLGSRAG